MKKLTLSVFAVFLCVSALYARDFNIMDFGAVPDGRTKCTEAVQAAIDAAGRKGGTVVVPLGRFVIAPIELRSNVELRIEEGATLLGSTDPRDYLVDGGEECKPGLIYGFHLEDVKIYGGGTIDGQGRELAHQQDSLYFEGVWKWYDQNTHCPDGRIIMFHLGHIKGLTMLDLNILNCNMFAMGLPNNDNVEIRRIKIRNHAYWNGDGIDLHDSNNVVVSDCDVQASDDGIGFGSLDHACSSSNVLVENCRIQCSASAIKFGTPSFGIYRNITVRNIYVYDTYRSAIAFECVDGGIVENVLLENFTVVNSGNAIFLRIGRRRTNPNVPRSQLRNITIRNMKAQIAYGLFGITKDYDMQGPPLDGFYNTIPSSIVGIPGMKVEDVLLENIEIDMPGRGNDGLAWCPEWKFGMIPEKEDAYPEYDMFRELPAWAMYIRHASGIEFRNVTVRAEKPDYRPAYVFDDVDGIKMTGAVICEDDQNPQILLRNVTGASLDIDPNLVKVVEK